MGKSWDENSCIMAIQLFFKEYKRIPTRRDFIKNEKYPSYGTVIRYHGSWSNALAVAGLSSRHKHQPIWNKESIKESILVFYKLHNRIPAQKDFANNSSCPNHKTVARHYGSWNNAIIAAGLSPKYLINASKEKWTKQLISEKLKKISKILGYTPSLQEFSLFEDTPSDSVVKTRFGTWNKAVLYAGLSPVADTKFTKDSIAALLNNYIQEHGYTPSEHLFCSIESNPSKSTILKYWDSWNSLLEHLQVPPSVNNGYGIATKGLDGHIYRSQAEAYFSNTFLFNQYVYEIEPKYPYPYKKLYDWYVPKLDLYIELDGGCRLGIMKEKIVINNSLKRKLLIISYSDLYKYNMDDTLEDLWEKEAII